MIIYGKPLAKVVQMEETKRLSKFIMSISLFVVASNLLIYLVKVHTKLSL